MLNALHRSSITLSRHTGIPAIIKNRQLDTTTTKVSQLLVWQGVLILPHTVCIIGNVYHVDTFTLEIYRPGGNTRSARTLWQAAERSGFCFIFCFFPFPTTLKKHPSRSKWKYRQDATKQNQVDNRTAFRHIKNKMQSTWININWVWCLWYHGVYSSAVINVTPFHGRINLQTSVKINGEIVFLNLKLPVSLPMPLFACWILYIMNVGCRCTHTPGYS